MTQKNLSAWLNALILGVGIALPLLVFFILPTGIGMHRILHTAFWCLAAIPCEIALLYSRKIAMDIRLDQSFTEKNAHRLKCISFLAAIDSAYLAVGGSLRFFFGADPLSLLLLALVVAAFGIVLSVAFAALSHLVLKASALQKENDLTI